MLNTTKRGVNFFSRLLLQILGNIMGLDRFKRSYFGLFVENAVLVVVGRWLYTSGIQLETSSRVY
jgi:hypothetical protein